MTYSETQLARINEPVSFKYVPGWDGIYLVSSKGDLYRSEKTRYRLIKGYKHQSRSNTYIRVKLCKNGTYTRMFLHQIVALTFIGNPSSERIEVDHIDGNTLNNSVSNLEYVTPEENKKRYRMRLKNSSKVFEKCTDKNNVSDNTVSKGD